MELILVRHGESIGNSENRLQGATGDLTDLGRRQAALTGVRLAELGTTALYASPLPRAHETARIIGERLSREPAPLAGVAEYDFGEMSGMTYAEVRQRFAADPVMAALNANERVYPGEEGRENFFRRVTESIRGVIDQHPGETVAIVSHGGPIALFCQCVLGLPYRRPMPFGIGNCSLTLLAVSEGRGEPVLVQLNDRCHLGSNRELGPQARAASAPPSR